MSRYRQKCRHCSSEATTGYSLFPVAVLRRASPWRPSARADRRRPNDVYLTAASSWEIAIKVSLGKLTLPQPPDVYVPNRLAAQAMQGLPIEHVHALRVASLPAHHQDPFDRLIVGQAQIETLPVLTVDENIAAYDVEAIWAGRGEAPWSTREG